MNERYHLLDFAKFVFIFGVIFVHFEWPGIFGTALSMMGLVGVVIFFLISGFFAYDEDDEKACKKLIKRFKRNGIQFLIALAVYALITLICVSIKGDLASWLERFKDPKVYIRFFTASDFDIFNASTFWFMAGIVFSYPVMALFRKLHIMKIAYVLAPLLIIFQLIAECYLIMVEGDWHYYSNFLLRALPYMVLGDLIAFLKAKNFFVKIPHYIYAIASLITFILTVLAEGFITGISITAPIRIICAVITFLFFISKPNKQINKTVEYMGNNYTIYIYLYHYIIGFLIIFFFMPDTMGVWTIGNILLPFIVFILSLILAAIICAVKKGTKKTA